MTIDPVRPLWRTNGTFPRANNSSVMGRQIRAEANPLRVGKIEGKGLYSYGIMLSF